MGAAVKLKDIYLGVEPQKLGKVPSYVACRAQDNYFREGVFVFVTFQ